MQIVRPYAVMLTSTPNAEQLIERAGRTCYKSEERITQDSARKFVEMINARGHVSVIEHANATIKIRTDRGITHEVVRHRIAQYSQESTRYCNYGKDKFGNEITVIEPPFHIVCGDDMDKLEAMLNEWDGAMLDAERHYMSLIDLGAPPELARSVLPNSLKTEIVITYNFRQWMHFLNLRLSNKRAHPQIRQIAFMCWKLLVEVAPILFTQYEEGAETILSAGLMENNRRKTYHDGSNMPIDGNPALNEYRVLNLEGVGWTCCYIEDIGHIKQEFAI